MHSFSQSLDMPFLPPKNSLFKNKGEIISVECPGIPVGDCKDSFCSNPGLLEHFFDKIWGKAMFVECPGVPVGNCKDSFCGNSGLLVLSKGHHWLEGQGIQGECELAKGHHQRVHHLKMPNTT